MTLPSSGTLALSQMSNEFGLGNPVSMSQMRGRGGAPSSGPISFSTMRGRSGIAFTPHSGSYSSTGDSVASYVLACSQSAIWTWTASSALNVTATVPSGGSGTAIQFTVRSPRRADGGTDTIQRTITITATSGGVTANFTLNITSRGTARDL